MYYDIVEICVPIYQGLKYIYNNVYVCVFGKRVVTGDTDSQVHLSLLQRRSCALQIPCTPDPMSLHDVLHVRPRTCGLTTQTEGGRLLSAVRMFGEVRRCKLWTVWTADGR